MSWLSLILIAYLILSVSNMIDKIFLSHFVTESIVYTIWVSLLSVGMVALFVLHWFLDHGAYTSLKDLGELTLMNPLDQIISFIIGIIFTLSIYCLYSALQKGEASRILPLIGGSMPIMIYLISFWYDPLDPARFLAFGLLVLGAVLISWTPTHGSPKKLRIGMVYGLGAAASFAVFFVLTQYILNHQGFINGVVWPRLGSAACLVALMTNARVRHKFATSLKHLNYQMRSLWLGSQALGALGFLGQQYVISLPKVSVALVVALQSVQYALILLFASVLTVFRPALLREFVSRRIIFQKIAALVCIGAGLYLIAV